MNFKLLSIQGVILWSSSLLSWLPIFKKKKHLLRPHHRFQTPHVQRMEFECPTNIKAKIWSLHNSCYAKKKVLGVDMGWYSSELSGKHGTTWQWTIAPLIRWFRSYKPPFSSVAFISLLILMDLQINIDELHLISSDAIRFPIRNLTKRTKHQFSWPDALTAPQSSRHASHLGDWAPWSHHRAPPFAACCRGRPGPGCG